MHALLICSTCFEDPMPVKPFVDSVILLFVLLNPFLLSVYLLDLIERLEGQTFRHVVGRGACIAGAVFVLFAWAGDAIFQRVLQARIASFLIFGGVVFLLVAIRFVLIGKDAISGLRGNSENLAGSVAMPFMIGPGTVSGSVLAGSRLPLGWAVLSIAIAMLAVVVSMACIKAVHDYARKQNQRLVEQYVDIVGRLSALVIGTLAIEMVLRGLELWWRDLATTAS